MTDLSIGNIANKQIFTQNDLKNLKLTDLKNQKDQTIFTNVFDKDKNTTLENQEIEEKYNALLNAAKTDGDATNLSEAEAKSFLSQYKLENISVDDLFGFFNRAKEATKSKSEQTDTKKDDATQNKDSWNSYTVQNGEGYKGLIKRSLQAQGIENPTAEQIAQAEEEFEKENPGAVKQTKKGVKYLLAGASVKIKGGLEDKKNGKEQEQAWADMYGTKKPSTTGSSSSSKTNGDKRSSSDSKVDNGKNNSSNSDNKVDNGKNNSSNSDNKVDNGKNNSSNSDNKVDNGKNNSSNSDNKVDNNKSNSSKVDNKNKTTQKYTPKVGDKSRYHKGFKITYIHSGGFGQDGKLTGQYIVEEQITPGKDGSHKTLICDMNGSVQEVRYYKDSSEIPSKITTYKNRKPVLTTKLW